jgi:spermidine synthase
MIPRVEIDRARSPNGGELVLYRRGDEFTVAVDGLELMGSRSHASEEQLATIACKGLRKTREARVLVGGLGLGYTARAALDALGPDARVDVAELSPDVIRWNRGVLGPLANAPLEDPRLTVIEGDVAQIIEGAADLYDAILLDVDNGPAALCAESNARLYNAKGLARSQRALHAKGVLAIWAAGEDARFTERLKGAGFTVTVERPPRHGTKGSRHLVWVARRP